MQARVDWVLIIFGTQKKKKKRPVRPVFPDCLSVSYDYGFIDNKNMQANIFRMQAPNLVICKYFWNGFFDYKLAGRACFC